MDGKTKRLGRILFELRSNSHDFSRAKAWANELTEAIKLDPGLNFELRIRANEIEYQLKEIALRRGKQLLRNLRDPTAKTPESYLRADVREIEEMKEKGILTYGELGTSLAELGSLARNKKR